jgi:hypothetical protein
VKNNRKKIESVKKMEKSRDGITQRTWIRREKNNKKQRRSRMQNNRKNKRRHEKKRNLTIKE